MTAQEMSIAFKLELDKVDSLALPNFLPNEIEYFLNRAQTRIIKQRYGYNNNSRTGFEVTQKRTDDLRMVEQTAILVPQAPTIFNQVNGVFVQLPDGVTPINPTTGSPYPKYWFALMELCNIHYTNHVGDVETDIIPVRVYTHDEYNDARYDPFNEPYNKEIPRMMYQNNVELITDGNYTVDSYKITYIKEPRPISITNNVDCELSSEIHQELIMEAVKIALADIGDSQRFQIQSALNAQEE